MSSIIQVSQVSAYLRELVETDEYMQDLWIEGEVGSWTLHRSGHAYFSIKDTDSTVDCVMWRTMLARQSHLPRVGDQLIVHGSGAIYEKTSRFQVKADVLAPAGAGLLQLQLERLRQRLEAEGLFDESRKRELPWMPTRIGVVSSPTGAVWHDIQRVIARRFPHVELVLAPAAVQGVEAAPSVVRAISQLNDFGVDVVIVARGGGSAEDLWVFNDERIVRAIFASRVPVISAIGHETDTTLADYVADLRAPTPSAAAEIVVPDMIAIAQALAQRQVDAIAAMNRILQKHQHDLLTLQHRLTVASPLAHVQSMKTSLDALRTSLVSASRHSLARHHAQLDRYHAVLGALDPIAVLQRGFAHVSFESSGHAIHHGRDLSIDDNLVTTFADAVVQSRVTGVANRSHRTPGP